MPSLVFSHVFFSHTPRPLLENVSFTCGPTDRRCVVGPNGSGKTTLLRLARGELAPERGTVSATDPGVISDQPTTVGDVLDEARSDQLGLLHRFEKLTTALAEGDDSPETAADYDQALSHITALDLWSLAATTSTILAGLGLAEAEPTMTLDSLSPGQRGRLDLAALLLSRPNSLILDEPTNHLDDEAREFLAATLRDWKGPVLFASHDRSFIDEVATGLLDLDTAAWHAVARAEGATADNGVHLSTGTYSDYLLAKRDARAHHRELHERQQAEKSHLITHRRESEIVGHKDFTPRSEVRAAQKFYADRAQTVSTRRKTDDDQRLERLAAVEVRKPREQHIDFVLPPVAAPGGALAVDAREAQVTGRLASTSFRISEGEHLLVTGTNGAGKSTLLRWVHAGAPPDTAAEGTITTHLPSVLVPQQLPSPGDGLLPDQAWESGIGELGKGFMHPKFWAHPVSQLSDGNQRRAQLAAAAARAPELLIIDEPTNFLDLDAVESLESALQEWNGTLIVATHDRWLIGHWGGRSRLHLENPG